MCSFCSTNEMFRSWYFSTTRPWSCQDVSSRSASIASVIINELEVLIAKLPPPWCSLLASYGVSLIVLFQQQVQRLSWNHNPFFEQSLSLFSQQKIQPSTILSLLYLHHVILFMVLLLTSLPWNLFISSRCTSTLQLLKTFVLLFFSLQISSPLSHGYL